MTKPLEPGIIYRTPDGAGPWVAKEKTQCRLLTGGCDGPMYSTWDGQRKILGRLPPDLLDATEWRDEYRLPPKPSERHTEAVWIGTHWIWSEPGVKCKQKRTPLTPGLVVAFRSWPERFDKGDNSLIKVGKPLVVVDPKHHTASGEGWVFRHLDDATSDGSGGHPFYSCEDLVRETDDLEVLGRIPLDQIYTATELPTAVAEEGQKLATGVQFKFRTIPGRLSSSHLKVGREYTVEKAIPANHIRKNVQFWRIDGTGWWVGEDEDIEIIQPSDDSLPVGTRFRFRSWPERWPKNEHPRHKLDDQIWVVEGKPHPMYSAEGQAFRHDNYQEGKTQRWRAGVLPTDDIEILSMPAQAIVDGLEPEVPPSFTWRGWELERVVKGYWTARKGEKVHDGIDLPALLDRICEAEELTAWDGPLRKTFGRWGKDLQEWCQLHATDKCGWDTCKAALTTADEYREQLATERTARENAELDRDVQNTERKEWKQAAEMEQGARLKLRNAFRAATGHDYEPGRDYSEWKKNLMCQQFDRGMDRERKKCKQEIQDWKDKYIAETAVNSINDWKEPPMPKLKPGDRFRFLTFPKTYGDTPSCEVFVMGANEKARYEKYGDGDKSIPVECWPVEGCTYELLTPKETPDMSATTFAKTRFLAKYASIFVLFSALSNPMEIWDSGVNWWTAPTALELGDWTRVRSCDGCNTVATTATGDMCKKCGGETFTERKAQQLGWEVGPLDQGPTGSWNNKGYIFQDGTTTLEPGNWELPK